MKLLGIPLLQSYTTEERRKLLIARSVLWLSCAGLLHDSEWLGAGNWKMRLLGDKVLYEFTTPGGSSLLMVTLWHIAFGGDCLAGEPDLDFFSH